MGENNKKELSPEELKYKKDFEIIKKLYGEEMAHYCRSELGAVYTFEGLLPTLLQKNFEPSRELFSRLKEEEQLSNFVATIFYDFINLKKEEKMYPENIESPEELFDKAGYTLYKCETVEDMLQFEKYYAEDERICTYKDPEGRLDECHVFWAVRKDVDNIKRKDFEKPQREDEYSRSVLSIQFKKNTHHLKVVSRYNHGVVCPDAVFSCMLDRIQDGIMYSFEKHYGFKQDYKKGISYDIGVLGEYGKYYVHNSKVGSVYYCNNVVINDYLAFGEDSGRITRYDKARYEVFDAYILDKQEKKIFMHPSHNLEDRDLTMENLEIENVEVTAIKNSTDRIIKIFASNDNKIEIKVNAQGQIIEFESSGLENAGNNFLRYSRYIEKFSAPKLKNIGDYFLESATDLKEVDISAVQTIGNRCLKEVNKIEEISLDNLESAGEYFLHNAKSLQKLYLPELRELGKESLIDSENLKEFFAPELTELRYFVLHECPNLEIFEAPKIFEIGNGCLIDVPNLKTLNLPEVTSIDGALYDLNGLETLYAPKLERVYGFSNLNSIRELNLPSLNEVTRSWLRGAENLKKLSIPNLEILPNNSLENVPLLQEVDAPNLREIGDNCFKESSSLEVLNLPNLRKIGEESFKFSYSLKELTLPYLTELGKYSFYELPDIATINLPSIEKLPNASFRYLKNLKKLYAPNLKMLEGMNFSRVENLEEVTLTNLKEIGYGCFWEMNKLEEISLPNLKTMDNSCFQFSQMLKKFDAPKLVKAGNKCLEDVYNLQYLNLPNIQIVGETFCENLNKQTIEFCNMPNLREYGDGILGGVDKGVVSAENYNLPAELKEKFAEAYKQQHPEAIQNLVEEKSRNADKEKTKNAVKEEISYDYEKIYAEYELEEEQSIIPQPTISQKVKIVKSNNADVSTIKDSKKETIFGTFFKKDKKKINQELENEKQRLFQQELRKELGEKRMTYTGSPRPSSMQMTARQRAKNSVLNKNDKGIQR